ncbi:MAG TPA: hypothetical protein DFS52_03335 [Myxococcales bacterium]|jgi:hypothetical protein|nr:hypothetical protein [Myxococcales bacterium]
MDKASVEALVERVLRDVLKRQAAEQLFLFGPSGEPFWCARKPIHRDEMFVLEQALALIQAVETTKPKPFIDHDSAGRYSVAALGGDSDLYVVCVNPLPDRQAAEARVVHLRDVLRVRVRDVRNREIRVANGYLN